MKTFLLWTLALVLMLAAAVYQRRTGPSYPVRGELQTPAGARSYELPRSHISTSGAQVRIPATVPAGMLYWRRYPLDEPYRQIPLARSGDTLLAVLPPQPPAGKVEYYLELTGPQTLRIPADRTVVLRYRGDVPLIALIPHILFMFVSMLIAVRAALGALAGRDEPRLAWAALLGFTIGGLILGPIVQKHAFGAYWTGWPFGPDLTDDKTAAMWLAWLVACVGPRYRPRSRRALIVAAAVVTLVVYLIPHSAQGSELDYSQVETTSPAQ